MGSPITECMHVHTAQYYFPWDVSKTIFISLHILNALGSKFCKFIFSSSSRALRAVHEVIGLLLGQVYLYTEIWQQTCMTHVYGEHNAYPWRIRAVLSKSVPCMRLYSSSETAGLL
jgi:hypothetical protein